MLLLPHFFLYLLVAYLDTPHMHILMTQSFWAELPREQLGLIKTDQANVPKGLIRSMEGKYCIKTTQPLSLFCCIVVFIIHRKGEILKRAYFVLSFVCSIWIISGKTWSKIKCLDSFKILGISTILTFDHVLPEIIQIEQTNSKKKVGPLYDFFLYKSLPFQLLLYNNTNLLHN